MRSGRPRKIRLKKSVHRRRYGNRRKGMKNPKQVAARIGRNRVRRRRRRK